MLLKNYSILIKEKATEITKDYHSDEEKLNK